MSLKQRSQRSRPLQHLPLCLLLIWAVGAEGHDVRPSEHGLGHQKDPGPASPAMVAFFRGRPEVELPEARNFSDPAWMVAPPGPQSRGRPRSALLAAGVACGVVGSALLAAAAVAYAVHARWSGSGFGPGWALASVGRRSGPEVRLGAA